MFQCRNRKGQKNGFMPQSHHCHHCLYYLNRLVEAHSRICGKQRKILPATLHCRTGLIKKQAYLNLNSQGNIKIRLCQSIQKETYETHVVLIIGVFPPFWSSSQLLLYSVGETKSHSPSSMLFLLVEPLSTFPSQ